MTKPFKRIAAAIVAAGATLTLVACSDADVASHNMSRDADNLKILRRVVFINGITDNYIMSIEGYCNIKDEDGQLEVVCKQGDRQYKKHYLGKSDNVTYFVEQLDAAEVSDDHYKVVFKPKAIVPEPEVR